MKEVTLSSGQVFLINETQETVIDGMLPALLKKEIDDILYGLEEYEKALPNPIGFPIGGIEILKHFIDNGCIASKELILRNVSKVFFETKDDSEPLDPEIQKFINDTFTKTLQEFREAIQNPDILCDYLAREAHEADSSHNIFTETTRVGGGIKLKDPTATTDPDEELQKKALGNFIKEKLLSGLLIDVSKDKQIEIQRKHSARLDEYANKLESDLMLARRAVATGEISAVHSDDGSDRDSPDGSSVEELTAALLAPTVSARAPSRESGDSGGEVRRTSPSSNPSPGFRLGTLGDEEEVAREAARKLAGNNSISARK